MKNEKNISVASTYMNMLIATVPGVAFYTLKESSKQNSWIPLIIGSILGIIYTFMIVSIRNSSDNNIFEINKIALGKILGNIVNYIFCITFAIYIIVISWHSFVFLKSQYLNETPLFIIAIALALPGIYLITKKNNVLLKLNMLLGPFIFILCLIALGGLFAQSEIDNLKPFLEIKNSSMIYGTFTYFSISILPTYAITAISRLNKKKDIFKGLITGMIFSSGSVVFTYAVLGRILVDLVDFPEFFVLRKIGNLTNSARIDSFIIIEWLISIFIAVSCSMFYIRNCLKNSIKNYKNLFTYLVTLLISTTALYVFPNIVAGKNFVFKIFPYICFVSFFCLNLIIFIVLKIKKNRQAVLHEQ